MGNGLKYTNERDTLDGKIVTRWKPMLETLVSKIFVYLCICVFVFVKFIINKEEDRGHNPTTCGATGYQLSAPINVIANDVN